MAPLEASGGHRICAKPEQRGDVLALPCGGLVLGNRLNLQQGDLGVLGGARFGGGLPHLLDGLGKGARELETRGTALSLLAKGLALGFTQRKGLAALAGLGAALGA